MEEIKKTIIKPTYYQITTFIDVLADQLIRFKRNFDLSACTLLDTGNEKNCVVRSLIIRNFINLTGYFTKGAFTELLNEQEGTQILIHSKFNESEKITEANMLLDKCIHEPISFEDMDLALVFFHGGDKSDFFSIITNKNPNDKIYKDLLRLKNFQSEPSVVKRISGDKTKINLEYSDKLNDYRNYKQKDFLEELKSILDIKNPIEKQKDGKENVKSLSEITEDYVFTVDNFIKMCFILIRVRANIPIIMMGETGCGKTSLIKKLSEIQNNGNCLLVIDNIHAGHTNEDIINFIENRVIPSAKILSELEKNIEKNYVKNKFIYEEKKLWVFFDELNTCKSMDLLSEIICKHSCQGKKLPKNIVFIGAVNPYRKSKIKREGLKIKNDDKYDQSDLIYTVNPMPHSLLNYVFDFGSLNSKDEKSYIENMVKAKISDEDLSSLSTELIAISQGFIREKNGVSSVSLREIRRFIILYEFFLKYLKTRKEAIIEEKIKEREDEKIKYFNLTDHEIKLYSINLSIYLGYYLRLTDIKGEEGLRKILFEKLNKIFIEKSKVDFLYIPEKEENFIADNVELQKGIAKNRALLENLFSIFIAVNTKIPIFIIGKPGCSKSLSVQLINNAMKGSSSNNPFFRKYPKMYVSTYQGALNSTSEGVKEVFDKAREILNVKENKEKISTFYFDEMGLAEHSPHNPLKVLHSELEYDSNEHDEHNKKISFLGISNWTLDSSKMNRGITIEIPEPNEEDIKTTSIIIAKSYLDENLENNTKFFENLGLSFYKYKQEFKKNNIIKKYEDFHGNRDFYHLIKYPATKIKEAIKNKKTIDEKYLADLSIKGIERNFGGLIINDNKYTNGINLLKQKLSEYNIEVKNILKEQNDYNIKEKIKDNLLELTDDYLSRYLLLITRTNIGIYLLSSFLKSINGKDNNFINYTILIGSMFIDDIQKEEYTTKILSKIKMNMEKDTILILKDFDSIYPSLYDLFNQNFVKVKGKNYARIALGNKTNSFSEVNNKFKIIIIVDEDKIYEQEIPFLNRFEKQNISFEYLMNEKQILIASKLYEKCIKMITYDENEIKLIDYDINSLLINCDEEELLGFVFMETQGKKEIKDEDYEPIEDKFISKLGNILPQDIILLLLLNKEKWEDNDENKMFYNKLLNHYNNNRHNNIKSFLSNYEDENNKIIIYTFTKIIESIKEEYLFSYNIKSLGEIKQNNIKQIRISSIQNEFELETEIEDFLDNNNLKIFILKLLPFEYATIDYLKTIIENKENEYKNKNNKILNKLFIFLVHLERINKKDLENQNKKNLDLIRIKMMTRSLSNLAGYNQIFIDDINDQDYFDSENKVVTLDKILKMKDNDIYKIFINKKTIFSENLNSSFCFFEYSFNDDENKLNKDIYMNRLIDLFIEDEQLVFLIDGIIMENINNKYKETKYKNILEKIIKEDKFSLEDICIYDIIKKVLYKNYLHEFKILYVELENNYFFYNLLFNKQKYINNAQDNEKILFYEKIKEIFIRDVNLNNKIPENEIKIDIIIGYNLPSKNLIEKIIDYINNNIKNKYRENDEVFKNKYFELEQKKQFKEDKQQYENNLELYNGQTQNYLRKNHIINEIEKMAKGEKNKLYNLLFDDYIFYFIKKNFKEEKLNSISSIKSFIKIILDNKINLNENGLDLKKISMQINWLEAYSLEIIPIIKMYSFLDLYKKDNDLNENIKKKIKEMNQKYKKKSDINQNTKMVNRVFYNIIGSLINILISNINQILSEIKAQENLENLLDNFKGLYYSMFSINNSLNLNSKEVCIFHETIGILSMISINAGEDKRKLNIEKFIDVDEKKDEDTEEEKRLKKNLDEIYENYKEKNNNNFYALFSSFLCDEFNKENNDKCRQYILEKILIDDNLIAYNILLIKRILFEFIKPEAYYINNALDQISGEEKYLPLLNDCDKNIITTYIMQIFDSIINLYFDFMENLEEHIISDLFNLFKEYLRIMEDNEYDNYYNENLIKIYILSFLKIYLNRFVVILCDNKSALKGKEINIINEISNESSLSNTIRLYVLILLYNKNNSLNIFNDNKSYGSLENYYNGLIKEYNSNNFDDIIKKEKIQNEDKYLFSEFFTYIKYPSFQDFKIKFSSSKENQEKYPLINVYINNDSGINNLQYLNDYNDFVNLMINKYSGTISRNEANKEEKSLNLEDIFKDENFIEKFKNFKNIWNKNLSKCLNVNNDNNEKTKKFLDEFEGGERLAYFLNDDNEEGYGIYLAKGYKKFIEWQNSFLNPIIKAYKPKNNNILSCYIPQIEKTVNVQDANNSQIIQLDKCFENTYYFNFDELLSLYFERDNKDMNNFNYNFEKIEEELGKCILPNKCLFDEKNIRYICYQNEGFRNINNDFLITFGEKYGEKELDYENKKKIFLYSETQYSNLNVLFDSFILLVKYLNNNLSAQKESKIIDFIDNAKEKYINFNKQFINYIKEYGKDITIEKVLNSFLYMEHICYDHLKEKIDKKFTSKLEENNKKEINEYFESKHKDKIITKKEISSAVRRFITRYLLNDSMKENIDPNLNLHICLERKYLWNNKIFSANNINFNDLIKEYLGKFSFKLQARHSLEFYNIIGDEENKIISEDRDKIDGEDKKPETKNGLKDSKPQNKKVPKLNLQNTKPNKGRKKIIKKKTWWAHIINEIYNALGPEATKIACGIYLKDETCGGSL